MLSSWLLSFNGLFDPIGEIPHERMHDIICYQLQNEDATQNKTHVQSRVILSCTCTYS